MLKDTPVKYSATPRGRDSVCTIQVMESNEFKIIQRENSDRNVKYSSAPHQVSLALPICRNSSCVCGTKKQLFAAALCSKSIVINKSLVTK